MFDTMTMTKAGGALCGALLIYLLGVWAAETIYHTASGHGDTGEEHTKAFVIEITSETEDAPVESGGSEFEALLAEADVEKGAKAFSKCKACHKLEEGGKGSGPHLYGVVGRQIGSVEGFRYSKALAGLTEVWTPDALNDWLTDPRKYLKGTKMSVKTPKINDRVNLVAYLATIGG